MEKEITQELSNHFELPQDFFKADAALLTLSMISLYFKEGEAKKQGVDLKDIEPEQLHIPIKELKKEKIPGGVRIFLDPLVNRSKKGKVFYEAEIGQDGFSDHLLELLDGQIQITKKLLPGHSAFSMDEYETVGEMVEVFLAEKNAR